MKKGILLILITLCFTIVSVAQIHLKEGNSLTYKLDEYNGPFTVVITFDSIAQDTKIQCAKDDEHGTLIIRKPAKESAMTLIFDFPLKANDDELIDALLAYTVSKKTFSELKKFKKTRIRIDCRARTEELVYKDIQPLRITVKGKIQTLNCIHATWGMYDEEMWILDNADLPLIMKVEGLSKFKLTEIN